MTLLSWQASWMLFPNRSDLFIKPRPSVSWHQPKKHENWQQGMPGDCPTKRICCKGLQPLSAMKDSVVPFFTSNWRWNQTRDRSGSLTGVVDVKGFLPSEGLVQPGDVPISEGA